MRPRVRNRVAAALIAVSAAVLLMPTLAAAASVAGGPSAISRSIKHVFVIVQEGHTFDSYFATFPGADGADPNRVRVPADPQNPDLDLALRHQVGQPDQVEVPRAKC